CTSSTASCSRRRSSPRWSERRVARSAGTLLIEAWTPGYIMSMQRRLLSVPSASIFAVTLFAGDLSAQTITATIDAGAKGAPIRPLIYGMFIEHAGSLLEQGFRAELLDDRKFYFAIGQKAPARPGPFRLAARGWEASGPAAAGRTDSPQPYA